MEDVLELIRDYDEANARTRRLMPHANLATQTTFASHIRWNEQIIGDLRLLVRNAGLPASIGYREPPKSLRED